VYPVVWDRMGVRSLVNRMAHRIGPGRDLQYAKTLPRFLEKRHIPSHGADLQIVVHLVSVIAALSHLKSGE
jgi:hypothetical protein